MMAATCDGIRVVSVYAPNGRTVGSRFYEAKLAWFERLSRWLEEAADATAPLVIGGDFNVAPEDADVWDPRACHGGTHVSRPSAQRSRSSVAGVSSMPTVCTIASPAGITWWDYRAGDFHKNFGMRIDHLVATRAVASRVVWAEIDREARKGKPIPRTTRRS